MLSACWRAANAYAISYMSNLPDANLDAAGHRNALTNLLDHAITAIQGGDFSNAAQKLTGAITRTDRCSLRGAPDAQGPSMDWVTNCAAQAVLYTDLTNALNILHYLDDDSAVISIVAARSCGAEQGHALRAKLLNRTHDLRDNHAMPTADE